MQQNSPEYHRFRENIFILHACLGIAALKAVELDLSDDTTKTKKLIEDVTTYYSTFNEGLTKEYKEAIESKQEYLQKIIEKFVKKNIV